MSWKCKIFGHKWDESKSVNESADQDCLRNDCIAHRVLTFKKYPKIGEAAYEWKVIDISKLNFKKL